jgi:hypothetical protein
VIVVGSGWCHPDGWPRSGSGRAASSVGFRQFFIRHSATAGMMRHGSGEGGGCASRCPASDFNRREPHAIDKGATL